VPWLREFGADVTCLISGRDPEKLFDMEVFGDYQTRRGLTFIMKNGGEVDKLKTIFNNHAGAFIRDAAALDLKPYDVIMTDFEPVTAWAAKLKGRECIGVANQYRFLYNVPKSRDLGTLMLAAHAFAPADTSFGLHWHHFNQPILPPVFELMEPKPADPDKIVVYLGFESLADTVRLVEPFTDKNFHIFSPEMKGKNPETVNGHIHLNPPSHKGFHVALADCSGVISNAGFTLASECIHMGKALLVKPQAGQPEQSANGVALTILGLGSVMPSLESKFVRQWLEETGDRPRQRHKFPDTGRAIADWIVNDRENPKKLVKQLWSQVVVENVPV
jgi:uncharacterized protein (TIGR00661 family)